VSAILTIVLLELKGKDLGKAKTAFNEWFGDQAKKMAFDSKVVQTTVRPEFLDAHTLEIYC
tara:strand:+ start:456 stop:638 length:183 start_codon:yes stop_codon:yes gene_type:complete